MSTRNDRDDRGRATRVGVFVAVAVAMSAGAAAYAALAARATPEPRPAGSAAPASATLPAADLRRVEGPRLLFRNVVPTPEADFGRLALVPVATPASPRAIAPLSCVRVHFARERGVCLEMVPEAPRVARLSTFG